MARAYGSSAHLFTKRETTYAQAATGDYIRMPFNRCDLGNEQGLIDDPVREHALISREEHEAWDVMLACQCQLRLAPSGQVIGIDLDVALQLAAARCYDPGVLAELLPAAEAGLVEMLWGDEVLPDQA